MNNGKQLIHNSLLILLSFSCTVTEGSLGRLDVAQQHLKSVPKLVVRKTQLENFLNRKVNQLFCTIFLSTRTETCMNIEKARYLQKKNK